MIIQQNHIKNFLKYRNLLVELIKRDIKIKYRRSVLGVFWSLLQPLLLMIVLTIVFSNFFGKNIENYPVYLLTGRLMFDFFSKGSKAAMKAIRSNASLIKKVYVPKYIFPSSIILSNFITFLISLIVLFGVMIVTKVPFTINALTFVLPISYILFFTLGIGLILSTLTVFFRDLEYLYDMLLMFLMYLTPIFYPPEIVPERFQILLQLNPLYHYVLAFRDSLLYGNPIDIKLHLICIGLSFTSLLIGLIVFRKNQDKFILHI